MMNKWEKIQWMKCKIRSSCQCTICSICLYIGWVAFNVSTKTKMDKYEEEEEEEGISLSLFMKWDRRKKRLTLTAQKPGSCIANQGDNFLVGF